MALCVRLAHRDVVQMATYYCTLRLLWRKRIRSVACIPLLPAPIVMAPMLTTPFHASARLAGISDAQHRDNHTERELNRASRAQ